MKLKDDPTIADVRDFLLNVMNSANERPCKGNPSLTKEQFWNMYMGIVINEEDDAKKLAKGRNSCGLIVKNLNREFGH